MLTEARKAVLEKLAISEKQLEALRAIQVAAERADKNERSRWGKAHSGWVAAPEGVQVRTLGVLLRGGYLEQRVADAPHATSLRRGSFGRGYKTTAVVGGGSVTWRLTDAGRTVLKD